MYWSSEGSFTMWQVCRGYRILEKRVRDPNRRLYGGSTRGHPPPENLKIEVLVDGISGNQRVIMSHFFV